MIVSGKSDSFTMSGSGQDARHVEKLKKQIPVGRLGQPEEIARVVHFLAADASAYITGQIWGVNGGMDM